MEQGIQAKTGKDFLVVANDFANLPRVENTTPLQSDSRQLPVADNSVACLVDITEVLWYQLADYKLNSKLVGKKSAQAEKILKHYLSKLIAGGVLIFDDSYQYSTGQLLDEVFATANIPGFGEPTFIGDEEFKLRVYRKQA